MSPVHLALDGCSLPSREVAELVADMARRFGLDSSQAYRLRLAADEITTNIVLHGYRCSGGPIDVQGGADSERVWLLIEDEAPPFDPVARSTCRPLPPDDHCRASPYGAAAWDWSDAQAGGFGLFLARSSLDEFGYERVGGRNRYTLVVRPRADKGGGRTGRRPAGNRQPGGPESRGREGAGDGRDRTGHR